VRRMPSPTGPPEHCPSEVSHKKIVLRHPAYQNYAAKDFGVCRFPSHAGESDREPGIGCGHPVVSRRGRHGGEVWHVEHVAPLDAFSDRNDLSSDLELSLTPSAESIIHGRRAGEGVRQ